MFSVSLNSPVKSSLAVKVLGVDSNTFLLQQELNKASVTSQSGEVKGSASQGGDFALVGQQQRELALSKRVSH